ncbi:hypothetical protein HG531_006892 [Fusarium graminearum]|nr:hypothetical protein HG531_006892 [Fusarium graminearum]
MDVHAATVVCGDGYTSLAHTRKDVLYGGKTRSQLSLAENGGAHLYARPAALCVEILDALEILIHEVKVGSRRPGLIDLSRGVDDTCTSIYLAVGRNVSTDAANIDGVVLALTGDGLGGVLREQLGNIGACSS